MSRKKTRPKTFAMGDVHVRVARGPHKLDANRWYWRAERYEHREGRPIWTGWGTVEEAQRAVADLIAKGKDDGSAAGRKAADRGTVQHLLDTWRADLKLRSEVGDLEESTREMYRVRAEWLAGALGDVRLSAIDLDTLEGYRNRRLRRLAAPRTVAAELNALRIAWNWGQERGLCPDRRLPSVEVKIHDVRCHRTPEQTELARVLAKLPNDWRRVAMRLYAATGARLQEIARLTWDDVDLEAGILRVRRGTGRKTGAREVPISDELVADLRVWGAGERRPTLLGVAPNTVRGGMYAHLRDACAEAKVERFTAQGLRRLVEDLLAEADTDPRDYADILGHSPETAMKHYRKSTASSRRRAIQRARLGAIETAAEEAVTDLEAERRKRGS